MELASSRKEPVILFHMGMNSYGKEFQYKELFLDLGILNLLKLRHTSIQCATPSFEVFFSEHPWCWNSMRTLSFALHPDGDEVQGGTVERTEPEHWPGFESLLCHFPARG